MAKKTVFEGVVNGVKFDNVKEYNEYLMKIIETGEPVCASTSTHTEEGECCGCCDPNCNYGEEDYTIMLPGCIVGRDNDKSYVDSYVSDNAIADKQALDELQDDLCDNLEGIITEVNKMDRAALEGYLKDVNEAMEVINADYKSTKRHIAEREQEIDRLQRETEKLHRAAKVLELWKDNYVAIKDVVEDAMTVDNIKPSNDNDEKIAKELEERLAGALTKLAECFGIDPKDFKNIKIGY